MAGEEAAQGAASSTFSHHQEPEDLHLAARQVVAPLHLHTPGRRRQLGQARLSGAFAPLQPFQGAPIGPMGPPRERAKAKATSEKPAQPKEGNMPRS